MSQNWAIPQTAEEYFSQQAKRQGQEERRPQIRKASDLLGPGVAAFAVEIDDFSGDIAAFNGFFIAPPGAANSPDNTKWWIGQTIATQADGGTQMFSTFQSADAPHTVMLRGFVIAPDSPARFYSPWEQIAPIVTDPAVPVALPFIAPFTTSALSIWRENNIVFGAGHVQRASGFSASFTTCATIPVGYRPNVTRVYPSSSYSLNTGTFYQFQAVVAPGDLVTPSNLQLRQDAANTNGAYLMSHWLTDDPMP